jgi:acyl carrier protein
MSDIKQQVRGFIASNFIISDLGKLADGDSLLEHRILDSTGFIELVSYLEEAFKVQILDEEMVPENLDSLDNIESYINRKRAG